VTLAVGLVAGISRFWALGYPRTKVFDEAYYATEARELLRYGYEDNRGYMFVVHPPLGKWCIAVTTWLFGDNAWGWRTAPAAAGVLSVLLITRLAMRVFRSEILGAIAGLLLSFDGISLVMSRLALLDIFEQTFLLAGLVALVIDRDRIRERLGVLRAAGVDLSAQVPALGPRPWRLGGGVLLGLGCAVKWSGLSFWLGFSLLSLLWDRGALKAAGADRPLSAALRRSWPGAFCSLGLAAVGSYLLTWLGWFVGENSWNRHWADAHTGSGLFGLLPKSVQALVDYHVAAYRFHSHLYTPHAYKANPWTWLVLGRPISFYYPPDPTGCGNPSCAREILLIGTPIMYWAFVPATVWAFWRWLTSRDWRAGAVCMAFCAGWVVWLQNTRRTGFLFYMTPLMPYLVLGLTMAIGALLTRSPNDRSTDPRDRAALTESAGRQDLDEADPTGPVEENAVRRVGLGEWIEIKGITPAYLVRLAIVALWAGAVIVDFAWMWPVFTAGLLTHHDWTERMWFPGWI
jgi:dolichyl-phosphate-mannose-protein mannosyltransferase